MSKLILGRGNVSCLKSWRNSCSQKEPSHEMITLHFHRGLPDPYCNLETSWFRTSRKDRGDEGSRCCCLSDPRVDNPLFQTELSQLHTLFCGCAFGWMIRFKSAAASRKGAILCMKHTQAQSLSERYVREQVGPVTGARGDWSEQACTSLLLQQKSLNA